MDWEKLKKDEDRKTSLIDQENELRKEYENLSIDYIKKCGEFENETTELKLELETRAFEDLKKSFSDKSFTVTDEKSFIKAIYNGVRFEFSYGDNFHYSIHFYVNNELKDSRAFYIALAKEATEKYTQVYVEDLTEKQNLQELQELVKRLRKNVEAVTGLLSEKGNLKFTYELNENYGLLKDDQFNNVADVLNTFKN